MGGAFFLTAAFLEDELDLDLGLLVERLVCCAAGGLCGYSVSSSAVFAAPLVALRGRGSASM